MNVHIRPYRVDDAEVVVEAVLESLTELQRWMPWCHPNYSVEDSRSWLAAQVPAFEAGTAFEFAIVSDELGYLGGCGLNQLDKLNRRANLGYWVRTSAARRGVATAAVRALRDWAFTSTDLVRLEIVVAQGNAPSHGVAEKAGAVREGNLRAAGHAAWRGHGCDDVFADPRYLSRDERFVKPNSQSTRLRSRRD